MADQEQIEVERPAGLSVQSNQSPRISRRAPPWHPARFSGQRGRGARAAASDPSGTPPETDRPGEPLFLGLLGLAINERRRPFIVPNGLSTLICRAEGARPPVGEQKVARTARKLRVRNASTTVNQLRAELRPSRHRRWARDSTSDVWPASVADGCAERRPVVPRGRRFQRRLPSNRPGTALRPPWPRSPWQT